jgi:putative methyltransferase (TIGR04325 family)
MQKLKIFSIKNKKRKNINIFTSKIYLKNIRTKLLNSNNNKTQDSLLFFFFNILSVKKLKVLDFGGGAGEYYKDYILPKNIKIDIFDSKDLTKIGRSFPKRGIKFISDKQFLEKKYDVIFINSVFQYIKNIDKVLLFLIKFNSKFIIFSDFYGSKSKKFRIFQNYYNLKTDIYFHNINTLQKNLKKNGYLLRLISPFIPFVYGEMKYYDTTNLPKKFQTDFAYNFVFEKSKK